METTPVVTTQRSKRLFVIIALVIILAIAGGIAFYEYNFYSGPCGVTRIKDASAQMRQMAGKWDDAVQLSSATSRIGLAGPVSSLQSTLREMQNLAIPDCLVPARDAMISSMNSTIKGFVAFMGQKDDATIQAHFKDASNYMDSFGTELDRVVACAPNCP